MKWIAMAVLMCAASARGMDYVVVVSEATDRDPAWRSVVQALVAKHQARVVRYRDDVETVRAELAKRLPTHVAFVARPEEAGKKFVVKIHQLMRQLDDDPYTDAPWGIVIGYDAADALRIVQRRESLVVRSGGSGAGKGSIERLPQGFASYEGTKDKFWSWRNGKITESSVKPDAAKSLADGLNTMAPEIFITSGHATEKDWQIGYGFNGGSFRCERGQLYALNSEGKRFDIRSPTPKVYLPAGNCLIGNIPRADCMATAWMHSGGVYQMFGYTEVTWFGYMGWGTLDLFLSTRYNLAEAFFFNNQALVHKLLTEKPTGKDLKGLLWDRDIVAFYGDPAWDARMPRTDPGWTEEFATANGKLTFTLTATRDGKWPGRPVCAWLPQRLPGAKVIEGQQHKPLVTDNFILLPLTGDFTKGQRITVVIETGKPVASAMDFLLANMPERDRPIMTKQRLEENIALATAARDKAPWSAQITTELFLNGILPYAALDEPRDPWRADFYRRFSERAWKCATPGEAALLLNREMFKELGVQYHPTKRARPNQSPAESIKSGYASCTGLSVMLVDACRACAIPARIAGIPLWKDKDGGNHNWVEIWTDGAWHHIGAAEDTPLDKAWFTEKTKGDAVDPSLPQHRIYAASFQRTTQTFPLAWAPNTRDIFAEDVTASYRR